MGGALLYSFLLVGSALYFTMSSGMNAGAGFWFFLWIGFGIVRLLWISELIFFKSVSLEKPKKDDNTLAGRLVLSMSRNRDREYCYLASRPFHSGTIIWMILVFVYGLSIVFSAFYPATSPNYEQTREFVAVNFQTIFSAPFSIHYIQFYSVLSAFIVPGMTAVVFVLALTFSYRRSTGIMIFSVSGLVLLLSASVNLMKRQEGIDFPDISGGFWAGYGPGAVEVLQSMEVLPLGALSSLLVRYYEYGLPGVLFVYLMGGYMAVILLSAFLRGRPFVVYALAGFAVLLVLYLCDAYLPNSVSMVPVWLSGWSCLAVLMVRSRNLSRKVYRLHQ